MPRITCPRCEKTMRANNAPPNLKYISKGREILVTNYAICLHCGAKARHVGHTTLIKEVSEKDWVDNSHSKE